LRETEAQKKLIRAKGSAWGQRKEWEDAEGSN